ncbi:pilus assembly PilX N-terminal domain-containing protein [Flexistipes sinusarabici]|uniref:pilus assembly PilX N-terminal domain-containing protein n=1 Tax=Flexistipes sinusarabici TaxID=2352 RepID=UPI00235432E8|nr:pilus assembly PilX N-terminal domain-containing protein [Flexistipes sinusarabici]
MEKNRDCFRFSKLKLNRKGFALVTVLVFAAAMLILGSSVYYFMIQGTKFSGTVKRYNSLKEATEGGIDLGIEVVKNYDNDPGSMFSGISLNNVDASDCGLGSSTALDEYIIQADPNDTNCANSISSQAWVEFNSGDYEVDVYIVKVLQGPLTGVGGAAAFPAKSGSNVSNYKYLFKITAQGKDESTGSTMITESLYRLVI